MEKGKNDVGAILQGHYEACINWEVPSIDGHAESVKDAAKKEAKKNDIFCEEGGMTQEMKNVCTSHAHDALRSFQRLYAAFMSEIRPQMTKIQEYTEMEARYAIIDDGVNQRIADEQTVLSSNPHYAKAQKNCREADARYERIRNEEGKRDVRNPSKILYALMLLMIGVGEIGLNFSFMLEFFGIPAFAFASSAVAGALVAWAAHEHGKAIKQHAFYFGSHVRPEDKVSIRWQFWVASSCLTLILGSIFFVRYIAVFNAQAAIAAAIGSDIIGSDGPQTFGIAPHWAALVSLGFNVAVWGVSVWLATAFHDRNPHYMDADDQKKKADARLDKISKTYNANVKAHNASRGVERKTVQNELKALMDDLGSDLVLFQRIEEKRGNVVKALANDTNKLLVLYKRTLIEAIPQDKDVRIYSDANEPMSVSEYDKQTVGVNNCAIENLIQW